MPKQKNIIQFSLPSDVLDQLEELKQEGESLAICAKRLLMEHLNSSKVNTENSDIESLKKKVDQLERNFNDRLSHLEASLSNQNFDPPEQTEQTDTEQPITQDQKEDQKSVNTHKRKKGKNDPPHPANSENLKPDEQKENDHPHLENPLRTFRRSSRRLKI